MKRPVEAELVHALERPVDVRLAEQVDQLVAQARRREVADQAHLDAPARQRQRVPVHVEAEAAPRSGSRAGAGSGPR